MATQICAVCGHDVSMSSLLAWARKLFLLGSGCYLCKGVDPDPKTPTEELAETQGPEPVLPPKWERPPDVVFWTCSGCGVSAVQDADTDRLSWSGGNAVHYVSGAAFSYTSFPDREPASTEVPYKVGDQSYCPGCCQHCASCDTTILSRSELEGGDTYSEGSSFMPTGKYLSSDALCIDCFEKCCPECGDDPDECTCSDEEDLI